ncbi:MAG TPA: PilZ domain-containing protein [Terriglobales bacterium]|jgi:CheY-like chemotaxis protein|nr:PilZ domain-containing protein [Terriglobales bacterium]
MGHRREERIPLRLPATVWGTDNGGKSFVERAHTVDISSMGARLEGLNHPVVPGTVLGVQHGAAAARFRVLWVGEPGSARAGQVGIRCVEVGKQVKKSLLYVNGSDSQTAVRCSLLDASGYNVLTATSPEEALEQVDNSALDAVVLTHPWEEGDLDVLVGRIRRHKPDLPIVLISAQPRRIPETALQSVNAFVHKGEAQSKLVEALEGLIGPGMQLKWPVTRCHQRHAVVVPLAVKVVRSGKTSVFSGLSTDLSDSGVAGKVEGALLPGEMVTVQFTLPTSPAPLQIHATVRHRDVHRYGFEFVDPSPEQLQPIRALCEVLPPLDLPHE